MLPGSLMYNKMVMFAYTEIKTNRFEIWLGKLYNLFRYQFLELKMGTVTGRISWDCCKDHMQLGM